MQPKESMYGSLNRLNWFKSYLVKNQTIVDIGCGTGSMITIPLIAAGYNVIGLDLDQKSIEYGQKLLSDYALDNQRLRCIKFENTDLQPDIVILSEVLEHLSTDDIGILLASIKEKLKPEGQLLITVPNGYGWFEFESFLWYRAKIGYILEKLQIVQWTIVVKNKLLGNTIEPHPSSLDTSPHIQRFTYRSIEACLNKAGFRVTHKQGGTLLSGPFTNLFFTGFGLIMRLNLFLGKLFSPIASDFYVISYKD